MTSPSRPEQDEAVRLLREGNPGNNAQGDSICWCACGCVRRRPPHWDRCTRCSQGEHLATPPPVPAAPLDMEMHHVLDAIADDEDGGPEW